MLAQNSLLLTELVTTHDVDTLAQGITRMQDLLFTTRGTNLEKIAQAFGEGEKHGISQLIEAAHLTEAEPVVLKHWFTELDLEIKTLPVLTMAVAIELPYKTLKQINNWLVQALNRKVILEVTVDKNILAGVAIYHKGSYRDYSLRRKLEDMAERGNLGISRLFGEES